MSLPHTPEALQGKHVRIVRNGHTYEGTVTSAGPYPSDSLADDLALMVHIDGVGPTGFWLPTDATVEAL